VIAVGVTAIDLSRFGGDGEGWPTRISSRLSLSITIWLSTWSWRACSFTAGESNFCSNSRLRAGQAQGRAEAALADVPYIGFAVTGSIDSATTL
jgi:hypothetical protein